MIGRGKFENTYKIKYYPGKGRKRNEAYSRKRNEAYISASTPEDALIRFRLIYPTQRVICCVFVWCAAVQV